MEDEYQYSRSPAWEELQEPRGAAAPPGAVGGAGPADESSDSEGEQEGPQKLIRKVSTSGQIRSKTSVKEGLLLKQTSSFQRWKKRYFKLRGRTLYYAKDAKTGGVLARWQYRVSRSRVCWRVLSVCWSGARRPPPSLGASGSEEGLVAIRVSSNSSSRSSAPLAVDAHHYLTLIFQIYAEILTAIHCIHLAGHFTLAFLKDACSPHCS